MKAEEKTGTGTVFSDENRDGDGFFHRIFGRFFNFH
jgi:hypothetical protein